MLKPLLFVLVIVVLLAISLNFDLFSEPKLTEKKIEKKIIKQETKVVIEKKPIEVKETTTPAQPTATLAQELAFLLTQAKSLFQKNNDAEALQIYEKVIKKSQNSHDVKILKLFAEACMGKATIHYIYPNNDIASAIESYELIIKKFEHKYNKELLLTYMNAKVQQSQFDSKDERITVYDELIEKFTQDEEKRFAHEIENLLFAKSFILMGMNDEEAIEVLDSIIAKYDDKTKLPQTVKFSILNNLELSIITNNDTEKYVDLANQYMADSPDTKPLLEMLNIIQNAQDLDQTEALEAWNSEHTNYTFPDWDFSELRKWVNGMETPEIQKRVSHYLDVFEQQKYKNYQLYPDPYATTIQSDQPTPNKENAKEATPVYENGSIVYEPPVYETDPYINDMYPSGSEQPIVYEAPNPYAVSIDKGSY